MLILCCIYRLCAFCVSPTYIFTAWEYCFFTVHFRYGVWRYLQIDGRKATSLTSFLFLYPLLIATIRRLVVAQKTLLWKSNVLRVGIPKRLILMVVHMSVRIAGIVGVMMIVSSMIQKKITNYYSGYNQVFINSKI